MCCCLSAEPIEDTTGKRRTFAGPEQFQVAMLHAPCHDGLNTFGWFCGQCVPITCGCTQYFLRKKVLGGDMTKYSCFQGYFDMCCCIKAGSCGESSCPDLCLCCEAHCCNFAAVSVSRMVIMERYQLSSDPCDYRLIRINNCLQVLSCICDILAIFIDALRPLAHILDIIADIFYHCVSGCMTAQTANEINYREKLAQSGAAGEGQVVHGIAVDGGAGDNYAKY